MQVRHEPNHGSSPSSTAAVRKSHIQKTCITAFGLAAIFLGLVALPETHATPWSPSKAGYKDILIGP